MSLFCLLSVFLFSKVLSPCSLPSVSGFILCQALSAVWLLSPSLSSFPSLPIPFSISLCIWKASGPVTSPHFPCSFALIPQATHQILGIVISSCPPSLPPLSPSLHPCLSDPTLTTAEMDLRVGLALPSHMGSVTTSGSAPVSLPKSF